jgi:hypothetical protein
MVNFVRGLINAEDEEEELDEETKKENSKILIPYAQELV